MSKGEKTFQIDGSQVNFRLDMNALCGFCEEHDIDFNKWDEKVNDPNKLRSLAYHMAKQGDNELQNGKITEEFIGRMTFGQLQDLTSLINEAIPEADNPQGGKAGKGNG